LSLEGRLGKLTGSIFFTAYLNVNNMDIDAILSRYVSLEATQEEIAFLRSLWPGCPELEEAMIGFEAQANLFLEQQEELQVQMRRRDELRGRIGH